MRAKIYKLKDGRHQVSYYDADGKRVRNKFNSYREAKVCVQRLMQGLSKPPVHGESTKMISELLREYAEQGVNTLAKRSPAVYKSFLQYFGRLYCKDITKLHCEQWLKLIKEEHKYSSRSMLICKYTFTPFFNYLTDKGYLDRNYMAEVRIKKGTRIRHQTYLSEKELMQIMEGLKKISPNEVYPVSYFMMHTGCKVQEALELLWSAVDLEKGTVTFPPIPNANGRTINLSSHILDYLKQHPRTSDHVFLNNEGAVWTSGRYYKRIENARSAVNLERHWDNFTLRHTFCYHFLRKGKTLQQLRVVIGHRNIAQTIEAYGNIVSQKEELASPY